MMTQKPMRSIRTAIAICIALAQASSDLRAQQYPRRSRQLRRRACRPAGAEAGGGSVPTGSAGSPNASANLVGGASAGGLLPPDRNASANWRMAGMLSVGGIRTGPRCA